MNEQTVRAIITLETQDGQSKTLNHTVPKICGLDHIMAKLEDYMDIQYRRIVIDIRDGSLYKR